MPVIPRADRIDALRWIGLSEPVVRLAAGEHVHEALARYCEPPRHCYDDGVPIPDGPDFIPLWDDDDQAYGVRLTDDGPEFLLLWADDEEGLSSHVAQTEQGLLAALFSRLDGETHRDDEADDAMMREAAAAVGFRYLDEVRNRLVVEKDYSFDDVVQGRFLNELNARIEAAEGPLRSPTTPPPLPRPDAPAAPPAPTTDAGPPHPQEDEVRQTLDDLFAGEVASSQVVLTVADPEKGHRDGLGFFQGETGRIRLEFTVAAGDTSGIAAARALGLPAPRRRFAEGPKGASYEYREFNVRVTDPDEATRLAMGVLRGVAGLLDSEEIRIHAGYEDDDESDDVDEAEGDD